jgi:branched-chain amino acid transport system permease protein
VARHLWRLGSLAKALISLGHPVFYGVAGPIVGAILIVAFNEASVAFFGASEINILGTGLIMELTLMYFPNGIVGTLAHKNKLPRFLNWD